MARHVVRSARWSAGLLGAAIALLLPRALLAAGATLDVGGFENYALGPLDGQNSWNYVGINQGGGPLNPNGAMVQSTVVQSGNRAVKVDRAAGVDNWWAVPRSPGAPVLPTNRFLLIDWEMLVLGTGFEDGRLGPYFGVEAYDSEGVFGRLGSLGVDATSSDVLYLKRDSGGALLSDSANATVDFGAWNHFAMLFDFTAGQYSIFLNGNRLLATSFSDLGLNQFTDADVAAYAAAEDLPSQALTGTAYIDNFRILDGIPGDFQVDGDVDAADLGFWKTAYHNTAVGDADGDLDSDGADLLIWQQNLGTDMIPAVAAGAAVPEPAALALVAAAACAGARLLRRVPRASRP